jgi:hypothetical protein
LKSYRLRLIAGFLIVLATAITLLVINIYSKDMFKKDLEALYSEKVCRNNFSSAKLTSIITYAVAFKPAWFTS